MYLYVTEFSGTILLFAQLQLVYQQDFLPKFNTKYLHHTEATDSGQLFYIIFPLWYIGL